MTRSVVANALKMPTSSIERSIQTLLRKDIIAVETKSKSYYVVDPAIATIALNDS